MVINTISPYNQTYQRLTSENGGQSFRVLRDKNLTMQALPLKIGLPWLSEIERIRKYINSP